MTAQQEALVEKARRSVEAAKLLAREGFHDFAVSRAYYAMFYAAEAFLLANQQAFSKHSAVIAAFGEQFVKRGLVRAELHRYLLAAYELRQAGDYEVAALVDPSRVAEQISRAEQFIEAAEQQLS